MKNKYLRIEVGFGMGFDKNHQPLENAPALLERVKSKALELFGGFTFYTSQGGWRHADGQLATEDGGTLLIFASDLPGRAAETDARNLATFVKQALNQEAVALGITSAEFEYV